MILSVDQSVREQVSRQRFLDLRKAVVEEYASWYRQTLPTDLQERCPDRSDRLAKFTLICADGNLIMNASGGNLPGYLRMAGISLIGRGNNDFGDAYRAIYVTVLVTLLGQRGRADKRQHHRTTACPNSSKTFLFRLHRHPPQFKFSAFFEFQLRF